MTILVTGGAGFIGSNFVIDFLQSNDEKIINVDKLTYAGSLDNLSSVTDHPKHSFIQGDICDQELIANILSTEKPRAIVHFAAESHVDNSINNPLAFIQTNIVGTFTLLEACRSYLQSLPTSDKTAFRFLHVSTDEVYGSLEADAPSFTELSPYAPNSPYSASKAGSDHLVRAYHHTYALPTLITHCSNNYGPHQHQEKLIPLMVKHACLGLDLPIYGDGKNIRDWLFVQDHCDALIKILESGKVGEVYAIGGMTEKTNIEVVQTICEILDRIYPKQDGTSYQHQIKFIKDRPGHDRRYAINPEKMQGELGWAPRENFDSGIEKTIRWLLTANKTEALDQVAAQAS